MDVGSESRNRGDTIPGASIIVLRRDAVLMVERSREPSKGLWSFPAGRAEPGEEPEANARRELFEETRPDRRTRRATWRISAARPIRGS